MARKTVKLNNKINHFKRDDLFKKFNFLHLIIAALLLFIIFLSIDSYNKTTIIKSLLLDKSGQPTVENVESETIKVDKKYTTDVLVIGENGAGLVSAISASEYGARVLVVDEDFVDKYDVYLTYNAPDREMQKNIKTSTAHDITITNVTGKNTINQEHKRIANKAGTDMYMSRINGDNSLFDSEEWFTLQTWDAGGYNAKLELVETLCENAYDGYLWLKKLGIKFSDEIVESENSLWPRTHKIDDETNLFKIYLDKINSDPNVNILNDSKCIEILHDDKNKIIGVNFENKNGEKFTVYSKCIIIATDSLNEYKSPFLINTDASVLDENGIPLDGIYSCGKVTSGIHGSKAVEGNLLVEEVVFGRIAGKSAADYINK